MTTKAISGIQFFLFVVLALFVISPVSLVAQKEGTFKDPRDNRVYQIVKVGKKAWMAENLKFQTPEGSWAYNNDTSNLKSFGLLYDWSTANTACPKGWHLPSEGEWEQLIKENGGANLAAGKLMKADSANQNIVKKLSETGKPISTLLGGVRHADGNFSGVGIWGGFWSSAVADDGAKNYLVARGDKAIGVSSNEKGAGFSVRCVKK